MTNTQDTGDHNLDFLQSVKNDAISAEQAGNNTEAERLFKQVLSGLERFDGESTFRVDIALLRATTLRGIGAAAQRRGEYQPALQHYQAALSLSQEVNDLPGVQAALSNCGVVYYSLSDHAKALEYYMRALSIAEERDEKDGVARCVYNIGLVYSSILDISLTLAYLNRALSLQQELDDKKQIAACYGSIGVVNSYARDFQRALEYHSKALSINEEIGNEVGVAKDLGNIGNVYVGLSEYDKALEYYTRTLRIYEERGIIEGVTNSWNNIGIVYGHLANYTKALECYNTALGIDEELGRGNGIARNLGCIGEVFMNLLDYPQAQLYLTRALKLAEELSLKALSADIKAEIGQLNSIPAWSDRDESQAEVYLLDAIATHQLIGIKSYASHKSLADLYEQQGRWQEANTHLKQYQELKEEVQSEEAKKKAHLMEQQRQIAEREKEIAIAKAAADAQMSATTTLLYKVLPQSIANRLINGEKVADYFRDVTILFADIVGFTPIASRMPAKAVLTFLNYVFGEFDRMTERHGCEKIKTIGDGYLAVAGAPVPCEDHAERITRLAFDMLGDIALPEEIRMTLPKGSQFSLRIGIHTGPCFGGIVGENRFVYDIYSDAVNLAARMESHGEPGRIHISDEFCFHLQNRMDMTGENFGGIRFDEREEMEIKGKGIMRTYFLEKA